MLSFAQNVQWANEVRNYSSQFDNKQFSAEGHTPHIPSDTGGANALVPRDRDIEKLLHADRSRHRHFGRPHYRSSWVSL